MQPTSIPFSETVAIRQAARTMPFWMVRLWVLPQVWARIYPEIRPFLACISEQYLGKILVSFPIVSLAEPLFYSTSLQLTAASQKGTHQRTIRGPTVACFRSITDFSTLIFINGSRLLPYPEATAWPVSVLSITVDTEFSPIASIQKIVSNILSETPAFNFAGICSVTDSQAMDSASATRVLSHSIRIEVKGIPILKWISGRSLALFSFVQHRLVSIYRWMKQGNVSVVDRFSMRVFQLLHLGYWKESDGSDRAVYVPLLLVVPHTATPTGSRFPVLVGLG